ncbi:MAG: GNAT family N-acyltransferase [Anaerolineae bacterium]
MPTVRANPPALDPETAAWLDRADELSRGMVTSAAPLEFRVADSPAALDAIYRLRYAVVIERGWAQPEDLSDGREHDEFDALAIHIGAWDGVELAATSRIILPAPGLILPTERAFDLTIEPRGEVVDMGRQIVAKRYSSIQHQVFAALLAKTWLEMHVRGYVRVCGDFTPAVTRLYRLMGFQVAQVGPARKFWGEERFPIVVDIAASVPTLLKRWGRFARRGD